MSFLSIRSVTTTLGGKRVLDGVDLEVARAELITIIGESGCGKSVLLKHLIGLMRADTGSISIDGQDVTRLPERDWIGVRRRIGMVFQGAALFDSLRVFDNVAYGLREQHLLPEKDIPQRVAESLSMVSLPGIEQMWPADLSGGMRKRVALARCIAMRPDVILYDGPTEGLDPINVTRVNRLIDGLRKSLGITTVIVSHNMEATFQVSDRVAFMASGRIVASGPPREMLVFADPRMQPFQRAATPASEM